MSKAVSVCPSILAADFSQLGRELERVKTADFIHIDIMDGHFVPNISFGPMIASLVAKISPIPLDVHLMVTDPELYFPEICKLRPTYITVHYEACTHLQRTLTLIHQAGCKTGVALNPATPVAHLEHILPDIDMVLIMTVNPGFGGQKFIPHMIDKIRALRMLIGKRNIRIQVDGGITIETVSQVVMAGADTLVAGSAIFNSNDAKVYMERLKICSHT